MNSACETIHGHRIKISSNKLSCSLSHFIITQSHIESAIIRFVKKRGRQIEAILLKCYILSSKSYESLFITTLFHT